MSAQPEALRLAQELDAYHTASHHKQAAAELRRLHEVNEKLLEALKMISNFHPCPHALAEDAIAKALSEANNDAKVLLGKALLERRFEDAGFLLDSISCKCWVNQANNMTKKESS